MSDVATEVGLWWAVLRALGAFNVLAWAFSSWVFMRTRARAPSHFARRLPHVLLSAGYVLGCAFRSLLPRADVQRIVLYDSWLSSVVVGRSVATVAELCFVAQWALLLHELGSAEGDRYVTRMSQLVVPLIVVAETASWYAVLTTSYLGNAIEQSLWTFTACLLAYCLIILRRGAQSGAHRSFLSAALVACVGFVAFMCTVDVPMYLSRWYADELNGRVYLSLVDGLRDVSSRWIVSHSYQDWREEIAWMTLYFSVAVWMSLSLVHAPRRSAVPASGLDDDRSLIQPVAVPGGQRGLRSL